MAQYVALSTENAALLGWQPFGVSDSRADARQQAEARIHDDTRLRNLRVLSVSAARREGLMRTDEIVLDCDEHGPYLAGGRNAVYDCPGVHEAVR